MKFQTNFLREREKRAKGVSAALSAVIVVLLLLSVANAALYITWSRKAGEAGKRVDLVAGQVKMQEKKATPSPGPTFLAGFKEEVAFANSLIFRKSFSWTSLLGRIEKAVPKGIGITRISPALKGGAEMREEVDISLYGDATSVEAMTNLIMDLENSPWFGDVFLLQQTLRDNDGRDVISFEMKLKYHPDGKGARS